MLERFQEIMWATGIGAALAWGFLSFGGKELLLGTQLKGRTLPASTQMSDLLGSSEQQVQHSVEICNHSEQPLIYATVAYFDQKLSSWVQKGWYSVHRGNCILPVKDQVAPFFGFVESARRHVEWGGADSGPRFCIHANDRFTYKLENCNALIAESSLVRWQRFTQLGVSSTGGMFRWDIVE